MRSQRHGIGQLIVKHKYIERHIHADAIRMRHGAPAGKLIVCKALRTHAGVKAAQPRIDGIGARRDGSEHLIESAGRRQQLWQRRCGPHRDIPALLVRFHRPKRHG